MNLLVKHIKLSFKISRSGKRLGFTLLELLVVLFIISLVTAVISFKTTQSLSSRELYKFAYLLKSQLELAREEAILQMATLGLSFSGQNYEFYKYKKNEGSLWIPLKTEDRFWKRYKIPQGISLSLAFENKLETKSKVANQSTQPEILFYPSGELSPFYLRLDGQSLKMTLVLRAYKNGVIEITRDSS